MFITSNKLTCASSIYLWIDIPSRDLGFCLYKPHRAAGVRADSSRSKSRLLTARCNGELHNEAQPHRRGIYVQLST